MRIRFCGVRGSTPAPGPDFVRTGGHTSCVAVWPDGGGAPRLLLDAGTGIRAVTDLLDGAPFRGTILLTHLHWDHLQGLPFVAAADRDDAEVELLLPVDPAEGDATEVLRRAMSPPHFPIGPEGLRGRWVIRTITEGIHDIEGLEVTAREVAHKGGRTFGYRVVAPSGASVAYLPDHRPPLHGPRRAAALALATGVDLLVHDAQFLSDEDRWAEAYGHATVDQATAFADEAGARELVLFHHAPNRTDDAVGHVLTDARAASMELRISLAVEGAERDVGVTSGAR